jgi:hypothetical protein
MGWASTWRKFITNLVISKLFGFPFLYICNLGGKQKKERI